MGLNHVKNRSRKSCDTLPLDTLDFVLCQFLELIPHLFGQLSENSSGPHPSCDGLIIHDAVLLYSGH